MAHVIGKDLARLIEMDDGSISKFNSVNWTLSHPGCSGAKRLYCPNVSPSPADWEWTSKALNMDMEELKSLADEVATERFYAEKDRFLEKCSNGVER